MLKNLPNHWSYVSVRADKWQAIVESHCRQKVHLEFQLVTIIIGI